MATKEKETIIIDKDEYINLLKTKTAVESKTLPSTSQEEKTTTISLKRLWKEVKKTWIIPVAVTFLTGLLTLLISLISYVPKYTATGKMYVNNANISISSTTVSLSASDLSASRSLIDTYAELLKTRLTMDEVVKRLKAYYPEVDEYKSENYVDFLISNVKCGALNNTEVFYISITDGNPDNAVNVINTILEVLPGQISEIIEGSSAKTVDKAYTAELVSPGIGKTCLIACLIAFVGSCGVIFVIEFLISDKVDSVDYIKDVYPDIPVLGNIPGSNSNYYSSSKYGYYYYGENKEKTQKTEKEGK